MTKGWYMVHYKIFDHTSWLVFSYSGYLLCITDLRSLLQYYVISLILLWSNLYKNELYICNLYTYYVSFTFPIFTNYSDIIKYPKSFYKQRNLFLLNSGHFLLLSTGVTTSLLSFDTPRFSWLLVSSHYSSLCLSTS